MQEVSSPYLGGSVNRVKEHLSDDEGDVELKNQSSRTPILDKSEAPMIKVPS